MELSALTVLILVVVSPVAAQEEQAIHGFPDGAATPQIAGLSHNDLSNVNAELDADLAEDEILPCKLSPCLPVCNDIVKNTTAGPVTNLVCAPALACLNANSKCLEMLRTQQKTAQNELTKALKIGSKKEAYPSPDYPLTSADATAGTKSRNAGASKGASFKRGRRRTQGNCALDGKCAHGGSLGRMLRRRVVAWAKVCPAGQYCRGGGTFGTGLFHCTARPGGHTNAFVIKDSNLKSGKYDNNYGGACNPIRTRPPRTRPPRAAGAASASGEEHFKLKSEQKNGVKLPKFKRVEHDKCGKSFEVDMTSRRWKNALNKLWDKDQMSKYTEKSLCCGCSDMSLLNSLVRELREAQSARAFGQGRHGTGGASFVNTMFGGRNNNQWFVDKLCNPNRPGSQLMDCGTRMDNLSEQEKEEMKQLKSQLGKMEECVKAKIAQCNGNLFDELNLQPGDLDDINLQLEVGGGQLAKWGGKKEANTPTPTDAPEIQHSGASNAALDACRLF